MTGWHSASTEYQDQGCVMPATIMTEGTKETEMQKGLPVVAGLWVRYLRIVSKEALQDLRS